VQKVSFRRIVAIACLATVLVTACGGGDDDEPTGASVDVSETDPPPSTLPTEDPTPSAGCDRDQGTAEVVDQPASAAVPGGERRYLLTAPPSIEPLPVVLDLHGYGESPEEQSRTSRAGSIGLEEGFITITPAGSGTPLTWQVSGTESPDVAVLDAIVAAVAAERCVDMRRIYAMGFASGGIMATILACSDSERIAAVAVVAGMTTFEGCEPDRSVAMLGVHGTGDPVLLFNGGIGDASYLQGGTQKPYVPPPGDVDLDGEGMPEIARTWATLQGCDASDASDEQVTDDVIVRTFACPEESVRFVIVEGGGRSWPGSDHSATKAGTFGPVIMDWNATREAWAFFEDVRLPA
jgi:polyhydroxybutyrate depolymerase